MAPTKKRRPVSTAVLLRRIADLEERLEEAEDEMALWFEIVAQRVDQLEMDVRQGAPPCLN
jgi:hypothetical protein